MINLFRNHKKYSDGFTIIELLIVLPLRLVCAGFIVYLFYFQFWAFNTENAELSISNDAFRSVETISQYVREGNAVSFASPNQVGITLPSLNSSGQPRPGQYLDGLTLSVDTSPCVSHQNPITLVWSVCPNPPLPAPLLVTVLSGTTGYWTSSRNAVNNVTLAKVTKSTFTFFYYAADGSPIDVASGTYDPATLATITQIGVTMTVNAASKNLIGGSQNRSAAVSTIIKLRNK